MTSPASGKSDLYRDAGVDIDLAQSLLRKVKADISATRRPEALAPIGGFGGLFQLDLSRYRNPVLVSSIDGVGTKLMIASMTDRHDTVGHDIVNHCINDIAVQGAEPLYFLDYVGIGKLRSPLYEHVLEGMAAACKAQNVTLLGGETAEMPGMYGDHYDLVGCITGVVERDKLITGDRIAVGNVMIGLPSNGLHTNGYSLARKVLLEKMKYPLDQDPGGLGESLGEALLRPHTCYWPAVRELLASPLPVNGLAHITGGGLYDNVPRVLPAGTRAAFTAGKLPVPPVFERIQRDGKIGSVEMHRVFNMGIGMVVIVPPEHAAATLDICREAGFAAAEVGQIEAGPEEPDVRIFGVDC